MLVESETLRWGLFFLPEDAAGAERDSHRGPVGQVDDHAPHMGNGVGGSGRRTPKHTTRGARQKTRLWSPNLPSPSSIGLGLVVLKRHGYSIQVLSDLTRCASMASHGGIGRRAFP